MLQATEWGVMRSVPAGSGAVNYPAKKLQITVSLSTRLEHYCSVSKTCMLIPLQFGFYEFIAVFRLF